MRRRFLCGFVPLSLLAAVVLVAGLGIPCADAAQDMGEQLDKAIAAIRGRIAEIKAEREPKAERYGHLQGIAKPVYQKLAPLRERVSAEQAKLSRIQRRLARMRRAGPLADAWAAYKSDPSQETFVALYRLAYGRPPGVAEMADYDLQALIIHRQIVRKSVTGVGAGLIEIGKLALTMVDVLSGDALKEPFESLKETVKDTAVASILDTLNIKTLGDIENAAEEMAEESYEAALQALHGVEPGQDLAEEIAKAERTQRMLQASLQEYVSALNRVERGIGAVKKEMDSLREEIAVYDRQIARLRQRIIRVRDTFARRAARLARARAEEELEAALPPEEEVVGDPVATSMKLFYSGKEVYPADELTEALLPGPWTMWHNGSFRGFFRIESNMHVLRKVPFKYKIKTVKVNPETGEEHEIIEEEEGETIHAFPLGKQVDNRDATLVGGGCTRVDAHTRTVYGLKAGRCALEVRGRLMEIKKETKAIGNAGSTYEVHRFEKAGGQLDRAWADVVQFRDVQYFSKGEPCPDFFNGRGRVVVSPRASILGPEGDGKSLLRPGAFKCWVTGRGFRCWGTEVTCGPGYAGHGELHMALVLPNGELTLEDDFQLTSNVVTTSVTGPDGLPIAESTVIPLGGAAMFKVVVDGPAQLSKYRVRWTRSDQPNQPIPGGFKMPVSFDPELIAGLDDAGAISTALRDAFPRGVAMRAELIGEGQEEPILNLRFDPVIRPAKPLYKDIELVAGGARLLELNLFRPTQPLPGEAQAQFEVRGTLLMDGREVRVPLYAVEFDAVGPVAELLAMNAREDPGFTVDVDRLGLDHVGEGRLLVYKHQRQSTFPSEEAAPPLLKSQGVHVTVNHLRLEQHGAGPGAKLVFRVFGPADMSQFKLDWDFGDGVQRTSRFQNRGGVWYSELPVGDGVSGTAFTQARLISPHGKLTAIYAEAVGAVPRQPTLTLDLPETAGAGARVVLVAHAEHLPEGEEKNYRCRWLVDEAAGAVWRRESRLFVTGPGRGTARTVLELARNLPDGEPLPVEAELVRRFGAGEGE